MCIRYCELYLIYHTINLNFPFIYTVVTFSATWTSS